MRIPRKKVPSQFARRHPSTFSGFAVGGPEEAKARAQGYPTTYDNFTAPTYTEALS